MYITNIHFYLVYSVFRCFCVYVIFSGFVSWFLGYFVGLCAGISLGKVGAHVTLQVEVGKFLVLGNLEKTSKLCVRVDLAAIGLVLEVVLTDILVDITGHFSASHFGTSGLLQELGKLVTDTSGLDEAGRGAVA